ncbi:MAG: sulfatase-like hydrolase/transferase [Pseudomonadales bacterium]
MHQTIRDSSWLLAMWAFIVTLPMYELLAPHPEFFIAHDLDGMRALAFVALVSISPIIVLIVAVELARIAGSGAQSAIWTLLLVALTAAFGLGVGTKLAAGWLALVIAFALASAGLALVVYLKNRNHVPSFALGLVGLGIPLWFLMTLANEGIIFTKKPSEVGLAIPTNTDVPIAMVILDELPLTTLLDRNNGVDRDRFPNLARFAATSTWYRNATTVGESTQVAVPAILSGELPTNQRPPNYVAYPRNLFTLLGNDYQVDGSEPYTRLCPDEICPKNRVAFKHALRSTLLDALVVFAHIVVPDPWSQKLPPITRDWKGFWPDATAFAGDDFKKRLNILAFQNHEQILRESLSDLESPRRLFLFRHLALPHMPWRYTHTGDEYIAGHLDGLSEEKWLGNQWFIAAAYQRHLLQMSYTDSLVGLLIDRLNEADLFDDAMIVIVADHGASFTRGRDRRILSPSNAAEIASVPLLIKYPKQSSAILDNRRVQTIDIFPTILKVLGADYPWNVAGQDLKAANFKEPDVRHVYKVSGRVVALDESTLETERVRAKRLKYDVLPGGNQQEQSWYSMGRFANLVGAPSRDLWGGKSEHRVLLDNAMQYENVRLDGTPLPLRVRGVLITDQAPQRERDVAIVINDVVAGVTKAIPIGATQSIFSTVVQSSYLLPGRNDVAVGTIAKSNQGIELHHLEPENQRRIEVLQGHENTFLVDQTGKKWPVVMAGDKSPLTGWLEQGHDKGEYVRISGWAVDLAGETQPESIVITVDGVSVGTTLTSVNRSDVAASLNNRSYLTSGFALNIPKDVVPAFDSPTLEGYALGGGVAVKLRMTDSFPWRDE